MCIIIYQPKGKYVPLERLLQAKERNPHGFGISWASKRKLHIFKTMDFEEFLEKYAKVNKNDCLIHFRFATKGKKEKINCHPFRINKNLIMAHNGTIRNLEGANDDVSDSRAFAHKYVRPMVAQCRRFIKSVNGKRWLKTMISMQTNKLVFMNQFGNPTFVNGDLGHWSMGCWYSNETYKSPKPTFNRRSIKSYKSKGYGYLMQKPKPLTRVSDRTERLPIGFGKLNTGKSLVDEIQEDLDLYSDIHDELEDELRDIGYDDHEVEEVEGDWDLEQRKWDNQFNFSEGFDCSEEDKI